MTQSRRHAESGADPGPDDQAEAVAAPGERTTHAQSYCEECETWDDHPKLHYGPRTMHHDCAPPSIRREVFAEDSAHSVSAATTRAAFDGCDSGLRGDKLRAHIRTAGKAAEAKAHKAAAAARITALEDEAAASGQNTTKEQ